MVSQAGESSALRDVATMFAELGERIGEAGASSTRRDAFAVVVQVARQRVDGAVGASVTVYREGDFRTEASSDDRVARADAIQYELGSGPCVDAIVQNALYQPRDLREDGRWPVFGRRVADELGLRSMLSYRLGTDVVGADTIAGLNLYAEEPNAFTDAAVEVGLLLATHSAALAAARFNRERAEHLERALQTSRDIGIAMGVLMTQHKIDRTQAFDLLRIVSQSTNRKLAELALEVGETGVLPYRPAQIRLPLRKRSD